MAQISNLNVQLNQSQINPNAAQAENASRAAPTRLMPAGFRSGTLVEGQVLSLNSDGSYTVRLSGQGGQAAQTLLARATVDLIIGEHFRAVWDASGDIPVLRLSQSELSFLSQLPAGDRELATSLLARGMPLSSEVLASVREAWRRMGGKAEQLSPILELWARSQPMTAENVQLLAWYLALDAEAVKGFWSKIRERLKERLLHGENPASILRSLKEGDDEVARFLQGHSFLLRAPRGDVDPAFLSAPLWPLFGEVSDTVARVFVGRVKEEGDRRYWQMGFAMEGSRLGFVGGEVESDGRAYNISLYAELAATCELLKRKRHSIRKELEGVSLALQFVGISQAITGSLRRQLLSVRGLDISI